MSTEQNKYTSNQQFTLEPKQRHEAKKESLFHSVYSLIWNDCTRWLEVFVIFFQCFLDLWKSQEICQMHKHRNVWKIWICVGHPGWPTKIYIYVYHIKISQESHSPYHQVLQSIIYIFFAKSRIYIIYIIRAHIHTPPWNPVMSNSAAKAAKSRFRWYTPRHRDQSKLKDRKSLSISLSKVVGEAYIFDKTLHHLFFASHFSERQG